MGKFRKSVFVGLLVAALALVPGSAGAGSKKREGSFDATALPYPMVSTTSTPPQKDSCIRQVAAAGSSRSFEAPRRGTLSVTMRGFTGDWDLYLLDPSYQLIVASVRDQLVASEPAEEEVLVRLSRGQNVIMMPCNWLGEPQVTVEWTFEYSKPAKKGRR